MKLSKEMKKDFVSGQLFVKGIDTYYIPKVEALEKEIEDLKKLQIEYADCIDNCPSRS